MGECWCEGEETWMSMVGLPAASGSIRHTILSHPPFPCSFGADWDVFQQQFEEAFTQWPLAVGTGNHERDWPGSGDAFDNTARDSGGCRRFKALGEIIVNGHREIVWEAAECSG